MHWSTRATPAEGRPASGPQPQREAGAWTALDPYTEFLEVGYRVAFRLCGGDTCAATRTLERALEQLAADPGTPVDKPKMRLLTSVRAAWRGNGPAASR